MDKWKKLKIMLKKIEFPCDKIYNYKKKNNLSQLLMRRDNDAVGFNGDMWQQSRKSERGT